MPNEDTHDIYVPKRSRGDYSCVKIRDAPVIDSICELTLKRKGKETSPLESKLNFLEDKKLSNLTESGYFLPFLK